MALFPSESEADSYTDLVQILKFAGCDGNVWTSIENLIGNCRNVARNLSLLPGAVIFEIISKATLEITPASSSAPAVTRNLSPVEAGQVGLAWRITRRIAWKASGKSWGTYPDELVGPTMTSTSLPTILPTPTMPSTIGITPQGRQIKAALVIDQLDEGIVSPADPSLVQLGTTITRRRRKQNHHQSENLQKTN
jgi:hypothetical protein